MEDHYVDAMRYAFEARASFDPKYHTFSAKLIRGFHKFKRWVKGTYHTIFWRTMFALGIGWTVGKLMCRFGIYRKFALTGICQYCGKKH